MGRRVLGFKISSREVDRFLGNPTRDPEEWYSLWERDLAFPIESRRPIVGRLAVVLRRLLRPLFKAPLGDLFERQRVFNLLQLEEQIRTRRAIEDYGNRLSSVESLIRDGLDEVCRYNDALYARVDAKLDETARASRLWQDRLDGVLGDEPALPSDRSSEEAADDEGTRLQREDVAHLAELARDGRYTTFEDRFRGPRSEILERLEFYRETLVASAPLLDLGCGRGELLELLARSGVAARGVDGNREMVRLCLEAGHEVEHGDLLETLAAEPPGQLGCVTAFHVIEHLDLAGRHALMRCAYAALRPGGLLVMETPSALSLVAGSEFWIDATHVRPAHPRQLEGLALGAGFEWVQLHQLQPYPEGARLSEISLDGLQGEARQLADRVNRLRDELDELLFGYRDVAIIAHKAAQ